MGSFILETGLTLIIIDCSFCPLALAELCAALEVGRQGWVGVKLKAVNCVEDENESGPYSLID